MKLKPNDVVVLNNPVKSWYGSHAETLHGQIGIVLCIVEGCYKLEHVGPSDVKDGLWDTGMYYAEDSDLIKIGVL